MSLLPYFLKNILIFITLVSVFTISFSVYASKPVTEITIAIWGPPAELFKKNNYQVPCREINEYIPIDETRRDNIDLLIFCQAFNQSDLNIVFNLIVSTEYQKAITIAKKDFAKSVSFTVWKEDINQEDFYYSETVIKSGEYQKGLYTLPDHPLQKVDVSKNTLILEKHSIVTVKNWVLDCQAALDITNNIALSSGHKHIFSMINARRADFTLLGFGLGDDMSQTKNGITLIPLKGVKISFFDSRHFMIKKTAQKGKLLITKLNDGLKALHRSGYIQERYKNAGLFKEGTDDWKVLNNPLNRPSNSNFSAR